MTMAQNKILLVGDYGVGKTTFLQRFVNGQFERKYIPTIGVELAELIVNGQKFIVWDFAGQERFSVLQEGMYTGASHCIIVYDDRTVSSVESWKAKVRNICPEISFTVVKNKSDCLLSNRCEADHSLISVKENRGVEEVFVSLQSRASRIATPFHEKATENARGVFVRPVPFANEWRHSGFAEVLQ